MKKYILMRTIRSIFSVFAVVTIAFIMVYTLVPRDRAFKNDPMITKLGGNPDGLLNYKLSVWEKLGYLDLQEQKNMCSAGYTDATEYTRCMVPNSYEIKTQAEKYILDGYIVGYYPKSGLAYATKDIPIFTRTLKWYSHLITIDTPWAITDSTNSNLERKIYLGTDLSGIPAIKCSGCKNQYLFYLDGSFPFIHSNLISFNMGLSYPDFNGIPVLNVISDEQGTYVSREVTFATGSTQNSPINEHKCAYKPTSSLDRLDKMKYVDNYADCGYYKKDPSMISLSFIIGIAALFLSYAIGLPLGIVMASNKGKMLDKVGLAFVTFMISIPSLAFIYFLRYANAMVLKLPDKFPTFGSSNILSYISPILILGVLSISGLIIWVRRYMIDQSSSDYVKFARAKGLSQREIFLKHILRNAIIPIAQGLPAAIIATIGGAVMTETIFSSPGMGKMLPDAVNNFNNPMIIALTFIFTVLSIFSVFAGDILITFIDPRISLANKGGRK